MSVQDSLEETIEAFNLDTELASHQDLQEAHDRLQQDESVQQRAIEKTIVRPYTPDEGNFENEVEKILFENGNQLVLTVNYRPECPSCGHMASDPDEPHNLQGACGTCDTQTCPACTNTCDACGSILCGACARGDSLQYVEHETLCSDCAGVVAEEVRYQRDSERREMQHNDHLDQREWALNERECLFDEQLESKKLRLQFLKALMDHRESQLELEKGEHEGANEERAAFRRNAVRDRRTLR